MTPRVKWFTLLLGIWVTVLVTAVTVRLFWGPVTDIPGGTAAAYASLLGLPSIVYGLFQWARNRK